MLGRQGRGALVELGFERTGDMEDDEVVAAADLDTVIARVGRRDR